MSSPGKSADPSLLDSALSDAADPETHCNGAVATGFESQQETLDRFFRTVAPQAKRFAMSITRRWCDAEELVQEACFRMTRTEQDEQREVDLRHRKAYLFRTIRNLAIDRQRNRQRRQTESRSLDSIAAQPKPSPARQQRQLEGIEQAVTEVCQTMPAQWNDALKLKVNGKLSYSEIAEVLDATPGQVRGWIYRARKKLAAELEQRGLLESE